MVASGYASPIFEFYEHVFNAMALTVGLGVIGKFDVSVLASGDAGLDALCLKG